MTKKITKLLAPRFGLYFLVMVVFAAVTFALTERKEVAIAELVIIVILYAVYLAIMLRRKKMAASYLGELMGSVDDATRDSTMNCPLPVVMFRPDTDEVMWSNDRFLSIAGNKEVVFDTKMADLAPQFNSRWLMEGKSECPEEVILGNRRYQVFGQLSRTGKGREEGLLATTYWMDVTELSNTRDIYKATRPVLAILLLDNYEDAIASQEDNIQSAMLNEISQKMKEWMGDVGGVFYRLNRDRYLFLFEEQYLSDYKAEKFAILDRVREVQSAAGIPVTMSIGIGVDGENFAELFRFANLSTEMALSRGGDQAVIKNRFGFEFFGGRVKETEKRTKVKSRVMASALGELVADASKVVVMGHFSADMDAVGAAVGVCAIARKKGVPYYMIREANPTPADDLYQRVEKMPEYANRFVGAQDALLWMDTDTLLVVVDTNRPDQVASLEVLTSCNKVAVIDHHRRAAQYIEGAALNFHEPYASSASELVTELITYNMEPAELLKGEAEALMAGLMLDTKNFTMRTGGRTFEAAAYLRRAGGDTNNVRKLFQNNLADTIAKYDIIRNAGMYRADIAIAPVGHDVGRATAAQAADELLNIAGITASFVLYPEGERIMVSARSSTNETNVQFILEKLGGGGNANVAGAQIYGKTVDEVKTALTEALDEYFEKDTDDGGDAV